MAVTGASTDIDCGCIEAMPSARSHVRRCPKTRQELETDQSPSPGKSFSLQSFSKASGLAVDTPCL